MKATKLVLGASLLIALAAAAVPTVSASGVKDCTPLNGYGVMGFGGDQGEISDCAITATSACQDNLHPDERIIQYAPCVILG